jgi:hypothetical protein
MLESTKLGGQPLPDGQQVADLLAQVILQKALKGDIAFVREALDRAEGRVPTPAAASTDNPDPGGIAAATLHALEEANRPDADPSPAAPQAKRRRAGKAKGGARKPRPGVGPPDHD